MVSLTFTGHRTFHPDNIYLFKVNNRNTKKRCCGKLKTIKTSGAFIVNFEHISHLFQCFYC